MTTINSLSLRAALAAGACLALLSSIGCGDDTSDSPGGNDSGGGGSDTGGNNNGGSSNGGNNNGGSNTGGSDTGGTGGVASGGGGEGGVGGTPSTGGAGGSGGDGGAGGSSSNMPQQLVQMVGTPDWEIVDYHQFSVNIGNQFENFSTIMSGILPPPNHAFHPDLGIGPGDPHAGPYDGELGAGVLTQGYVDKAAFTQAEGLLPNGIFSIWMAVPSAGAPTGSSPDFASGPIIPNAVFPIEVTFDAYQDGVLLDGYSYGFGVPALDDQLDPPFDVDGHSHFPIFDVEVFDGMTTLPGTLETRVGMIDANGEGWNLTMTFEALP